ncbi:ABC transporter ATP-binding protein [Microvirga brassicacearum]|uniref:ATP-binding cassette domain-containing protein n=1 Tax=Microvirga brassicacearum TaxID=2580413 RepID=A0A5N3P6Y0_9HYPH|nr:oligopeptide/dipeptide ABC transporter ATP-binding protein [Microvirga brassicacearum]KAB0265488.1 ATP-binding cassette domain-containing protein [Microvirga brassicacearum]
MTDSTPAPLVSIRGLSREFGSRSGLFSSPRVLRAVSDVSLDIPRGKVTGVVGESGCGKSTLARLALCLIDASEGSVRFEGVDLASLNGGQLRKLRRRMQMVFQDPYSAIDPRYTIREALLEPFRIQGVGLSAAEAGTKVEHLLDIVGLSVTIADNYPHQLSGGQKQRVGIARALALDPSFLVLDEPTASLDVSIQAQIIALLERLRRDLGLTYLFISHDLGLVRYFCDSIVVMYLGRIVEILPSAESRPRHPYTRALVESTFEPDPTLRRVVTKLSGEIPSAFNLPAGCAFAARCEHASDLCRTERPELSKDRHDHAIACHHPID